MLGRPWVIIQLMLWHCAFPAVLQWHADLSSCCRAHQMAVEHHPWFVINLKVSLGSECYLLPQPGYTTVMLRHCCYHASPACLNSFPLPFTFIIFPVCWDSWDQVIYRLMLLNDLSENAVWCMLRATYLHVFLSSWVYIKKKIKNQMPNKETQNIWWNAQVHCPYKGKLSFMVWTKAMCYVGF